MINKRCIINIKGVLNVDFNFDLLMTDIFALEYSSKDQITVLKHLKNDFAESYRAKYVDILFELGYEAYMFSSMMSDTFDEEDKADMKDLLNHFERFTISYARLIQYFDFADVDCPTEIWKDFNDWKNKRLDLLEYLELGCGE